MVRQVAARWETRSDANKAKIMKAFCALVFISILASACAPVVVEINSLTPESPVLVSADPSVASTELSAPTETKAQTSTSVPTETAIPTPEYGIDMEKFHNFPESYEYLLAHPDEFVQAPDPITDRAVFNRWFNDFLVPALGPEWERETNIDAGMVAGGNAGFRASNIGERVMGQLHFVYFKSKGKTYPVPCFHAVKTRFPGMTLCVALFDSPSLVYGTNALSLLNQGTNIRSVQIIYDLEEYRSDLEWDDEITDAVRSVGYYLPGDATVIFGFGEIRFK